MADAFVTGHASRLVLKLVSVATHGVTLAGNFRQDLVTIAMRGRAV